MIRWGKPRWMFSTNRRKQLGLLRYSHFALLSYDEEDEKLDQCINSRLFRSYDLNFRTLS